MNKYTNRQRGAVSTTAVIIIVVIILVIIGLVYWYTSSGPGSGTSGEASSTTMTDNNPGAGGTLSTTASGNKEYSNFTYGYAVSFPANAESNLSNAAHITFSFANGTGTAAMLQIAPAIDLSHVAYCLTVPQGATNIATTSVNGVGFLSYNVGGTSINSGTTYYRALQQGPAGNTCYNIQKTPQNSSDLNGELNGILQSFTFITSS